MASSDPLLAFRVHVADNTAVVLSAAVKGSVLRLCGEGPCGEIFAGEDIPSGHKIALSDIPAGAPVLRYGSCIGEATRDIRRGKWVHLQNCRSLLDERSADLDPHTGEAKDTPYE